VRRWLEEWLVLNLQLDPLASSRIVDGLVIEEELGDVRDERVAWSASTSSYSACLDRHV
jgi:hypothetical protein